MRQRASFARVLQADPELLLLDEPFSNMDTGSVEQMLELLKDFRTWPVVGGGARTIVLTTHQAQLALPLADRVSRSRTASLCLRPRPRRCGGEAWRTWRRRMRRGCWTGWASRMSCGRTRWIREDLTAISVARKIGMPAEQVFKTLLTQTAGGRACVCGDSGRCGAGSEEAGGGVRARRRRSLRRLKEVEPLTGYVRGGVTVLAAKKHFPAFADETIELFDVISVSAGQRGLQIVLSPADYLRASEGELADLTKSVRRRGARRPRYELPADTCWIHLRKDLRLEWRSREAINGMLFFSLLVVVVFSLAFDPTAYPTIARQIAGGILWVATAVCLGDGAESERGRGSSGTMCSMRSGWRRLRPRRCFWVRRWRTSCLWALWRWCWRRCLRCSTTCIRWGTCGCCG